MRRGDAFDAFYREHRLPVLQQTYAFVGDVETAERATSDAFAQAVQHWRRLEHDQHPDGWLRVRAFRASGHPRNRPRRPWYERAARIDDANRPLLLGLQELAPTARTLVILRHLVGLDLPAAAREAGVADGPAAELLDRAMTGLRIRLPDLAEDTLRAGLAALGRDLAGVPEVTPSVLRREGRRRRRSRTVLVGLATLAVLMVAGALTAVTPEPRRAAAPAADTQRWLPVVVPAVRVSQLLPLDRITVLASTATWRVRSTSWDNATTRPVDSCLPFVTGDPHAVHSWVRRFSFGRGSASQSLQVSLNRSAARAAYRRTVDAYGRCSAPGRQLTAYDRLRGTADRAILAEYRIVRRSATTTEAVAVAQTGLVVTSLVVDMHGSAVPTTAALSQVLGHAVDQVCRAAGGRCSTGPPVVSPAIPPNTPADGDFLTVVDLPAPARTTGRWVATAPARTGRNTAATVCDRTSFGSTRRARTRTFVIDGDPRVPPAFGVTETTGRVATSAAAARFVDHVRSVVASCHHRQLSVVVAQTTRLTPAANGVAGYLWLVRAQLSRHSTQRYVTAVLRVNRTVAQVTFTPTRSYTLSPEQLLRVVRRAGERAAG
jgi:DNA-directed RNA polymerase specialized sigma24 family protein